MHRILCTQDILITVRFIIYLPMCESFLQEYIPAARPNAGLYSLKDGIKYYEACLKWYFGYNITATEVYNLGISETNRIAKKMKEVMSQLNFHGDLKEFFNHLKDIPEFYNISESKIIDEYRDIIQKRVNPVLFDIFHRVPLETVRIFSVQLLYLLQVSYSDANPIPKYRRLYLSGKYYAVPLALPNYAAFMEGWATYAEFLGEELNLYKDPYELFGRHCSEIFRAIRLVVDPGIHAFGWTREQAINFITNYTEFPIQQVEIEVDRYITWPGQACTYKIGELKIKELRSIAERTLGDLFNIKDFHHQILKNGRISLALLEEVILEWIDKVKQSAADHSGGAMVQSGSGAKWLSRRPTSTVMATIFTSVLLTSYSHIYFPLNVL
eukprot:XP_014772271.1 PREDICTED: uncharacterized protein LOC106870641 [Octopus bimaculoides]